VEVHGDGSDGRLLVRQTGLKAGSSCCAHGPETGDLAMGERGGGQCENSNLIWDSCREMESRASKRRKRRGNSCGEHKPPCVQKITQSEREGGGDGLRSMAHSRWRRKIRGNVKKTLVNGSSREVVWGKKAIALLVGGEVNIPSKTRYRKKRLQVLSGWYQLKYNVEDSVSGSRLFGGGVKFCGKLST